MRIFRVPSSGRWKSSGRRHCQPQPTLIVNDVKTGAGVKGAVALWTEVSTEAQFRELKVTPE